MVPLVSWLRSGPVARKNALRIERGRGANSLGNLTRCHGKQRVPRDQRPSESLEADPSPGSRGVGPGLRLEFRTVAGVERRKSWLCPPPMTEAQKTVRMR